MFVCFLTKTSFIGFKVLKLVVGSVDTIINHQNSNLIFFQEAFIYQSQWPLEEIQDNKKDGRTLEGS